MGEPTSDYDSRGSTPNESAGCWILQAASRAEHVAEIPRREHPLTLATAAAAAATAAALVTLEGGDASTAHEERLEDRIERQHHQRRQLRQQAAEFRGRSGPSQKQAVGSGRSDGTRMARRDRAAATHVCARKGCSALVDAGRARTAASKAQRLHFITGDGCASATCSCCFRANRFVCRQSRMAAALLRGKRRLTDWPEQLGRGTGKRRCHAAAARAAASALLRLLEP